MSSIKGSRKIKKAESAQKSKPKTLLWNSHSKTSFDSISNKDTEVLILGTLPSDKSLKFGEYYGHPRNKFWKIIADITGNELPKSYPEKIEMLQKSNIGVWDIAHSASRKGSLDINIKNEVPNDIKSFIQVHKSLKIIGFNGKKAEKLFDKYFERDINLKYVGLPSTSPANASFSYDDIIQKWSELIKR